VTVSAAHLLTPPIGPLPDPPHLRGCTGKVAHHDRTAALAVAAKKRGGGTAYFCRWCRCWHTSAASAPADRLGFALGLVRIGDRP